MNKLNLIVVASIVADTYSSCCRNQHHRWYRFAQADLTMNMDDNASSMGDPDTSGNATSMTETESLPSANETGVCQPCCIEVVRPTD